MEITGFDNVFYSNVSFETLVKSFEKELKKHWPEYIVDKETMPNCSDFEERHERFYSKNQEMLEVHEEHGFNTKLNHEGCLYLIAVKQKQFDLQIMVNHEIEPKSEFGEPAPYDSRIIMNEGWQYTLVTPESIDEEGFSKSFFGKITDCIKQTIS